MLQSPTSSPPTCSVTLAPAQTAYCSQGHSLQIREGKRCRIPIVSRPYHSPIDVLVQWSNMGVLTETKQSWIKHPDCAMFSSRYRQWSTSPCRLRSKLHRDLSRPVQ
ncbi:hypothetical protein BDW42DRAFT_169256 [Aspergillus taichungensis]|uniref:Uncharacterized protein n=1 Tax=Aspergillus taichungensis TaxID=482145 RepID=A0A2J5HVR3_9EURO|nr:hypothetical protein BDW42DRAFT_169256 [Aspergillus taichungensis]